MFDFSIQGVANDGLGLVVRDSLTNPKTHLRVRALSSEQSRSGSWNYVSPSGYGDHWNVVMGSGDNNMILVRFDGSHGTALTRQGNLFAHLNPPYHPIEDRVREAIRHLDPLNSRQVVFMNQYKFHGASKNLSPEKIVSEITAAGIQHLEHGGIISIDQKGVPTITVKVQADGKVVSCNIRVMDGKVACQLFFSSPSSILIQMHYLSLMHVEDCSAIRGWLQSVSARNIYSFQTCGICLMKCQPIH